MKNIKDFKKLANLSGWQQLFKVFNQKEKIIFLVFLFLTLVSFFSLTTSFYQRKTKIVPTKGGSFTEGVIGFPRNINPVYAQGNDVDRDLIELVYSGLMKYNDQGEIIPDLAEKYQVLEEGKVFEFTLKENLFWSDGQPITADDVIFTIKTIQNPSFYSLIRASWLGVNIEKVSDLKIRFDLTSPSVVFLENCLLKILPKHIWAEVSEQNFPLSKYNLNPIGSGPYRVDKVISDKEGQIKSLELKVNSYYHSKPPYLSKIVFSFFKNRESLISAFNSKQIDNFFISSAKDYPRNDFSEHRFSLPIYFTLFLNQEKSEILKIKEIRQALNYGTDKISLIEQSLEQGKAIDSPILPEVYGFNPPLNDYEYNPEKAENILNQAGFILKDESSLIREKFNKQEAAFLFKKALTLGSEGNEVQELQKCLAQDPLIYPAGEITGYFGEKTKTAVIKFQEKYFDEILSPSGLKEGNGQVKQATIAKLNELCSPTSEESLPLSLILTTTSDPLLVKVAELLKEQWQNLGINLEIETFDLASEGTRIAFQEEILKPRNYQILLYGELLGLIPDPFPFWHSSQTKDPGLNIALYENKEADQLLEEARQTLDQEGRKEILESFQDVLLKDAPVVFLYSPDYFYLTSKKLKGLEAELIANPSKRFIEVEKWYIKTKRVWR